MYWQTLLESSFSKCVCIFGTTIEVTASGRFMAYQFHMNSITQAICGKLRVKSKASTAMYMHIYLSVHTKKSHILSRLINCIQNHTQNGAGEEGEEGKHRPCTKCKLHVNLFQLQILRCILL